LSKPITSVGQHHAPIIAGTEAIMMNIKTQQLAFVISCTDSSFLSRSFEKSSPQPPFILPVPSFISRVF